jgi:hypothetical protein
VTNVVEGTGSRKKRRKQNEFKHKQIMAPGKRGNVLQAKSTATK